MQEPVAAAMAHGMGKAAQEEPAILVLDIGGGTCDISLLQSFEGLLEVVGYDGDCQLGGVDLDEAIVHWLARSLPVSTSQRSVVQSSRIRGVKRLFDGGAQQHRVAHGSHVLAAGQLYCKAMECWAFCDVRCCRCCELTARLVCRRRGSSSA